MIRKFLLLVAVILMVSMTAVHAKINYVPLYIVDTKPDVGAVRHAPAGPLFITQDDHKLTLPEIGDSVTFMVYKYNDCVYEVAWGDLQPTVNVPSTLVGDYEVRLCADTYYYHGYITLEGQDGPDIPTENANWENITLLGSNTSQQVILDNILGLNVVEYNMKYKNAMSDEALVYLSEEDREAYIKQCEERQAELRAQRRFGLLPDELSAIFPSLVQYYSNNEFGINYMDLVPILISCIQELKIQLDSRTEKIVDIMMSRSSGTSAAREVRAAIGNTLLSAMPTSVSESAVVRYLLTDEVTDAYITVTDMSGRVMVKVPVSSSETSVSISSGTLGEGIFLCTLFANGQNIGTKRLVKTK